MEYDPWTSTRVMMHDGSTVHLKKVAQDYDPTDRDAVHDYLHSHQQQGEIPTGLLYIDESAADMHMTSKTIDTPLSQVPFEQLCPGSAALEKLQRAYR